MDSKSSIRASVERQLDFINFGELNDRWIDGVIDNEFTDAEANDITLSILFVGDPVQTLKTLGECCSAWCQSLAENEASNGNESAFAEIANASSREEILWTILDEQDLGVKHIQGLIYLVCSRATGKNSQLQDKTLGLVAAMLYFSSLRVPGSGAYSLYHPNLFHLCVDCMFVPDYTSDKDSSTIRDFERLTNTYVSTVLSLLPLVKEFHLGNDVSTIECVIKKLVEMTTCEVHSTINFNVNYAEKSFRELKHLKSAYVISALAYEALSGVLDTDLNGDKERNYMVILSYLNKSILCYKARKNQTIPQKHLVVKDNAVGFVCHNLKVREFGSEVTQVALKRLCLGVSDKTEIRNIVSQAVIFILFRLKTEHMEEMVQWILLLIDSAETKDRVFALDVLGHLLGATFEAEKNPLPESLNTDVLNVPIIFAILTRCDDVSPNVRTKALTVLSQNMKCILNFLDKTRDQASFQAEDAADFEDKDLDVNGNHRYFWYNKNSFRERLNEIAAILQRRIEDKNVTARKAALIALENLMVFDTTYITEENLKYFDSAAKDATIVVRKQVIQSLTAILEACFQNSEVQEAWLKCILPLVQDAENTVQGKTLAVLEEQFLIKLFSAAQGDKECAFVLLKLLSSGDFLAYQKYFQKAFSLWKAENKLRSQTIVQLEKYIGSEKEDCIWFFISNFALYSSLPSKISHCCFEQFEKFHSDGEYPSFMEYLLKVITHTLQRLPIDKIENLQDIVCKNLESFSVPVELIPMYIDILYKIHKHKNSGSEFAKFSGKVIKTCEKHLTEIKSQETFPDTPSQELLAKYFCSIKEFCHLCSANITPKIISLLKAYSASIESPKTFLKILSPSLKAHAFAALGKICLQDEILAKDLLLVFAEELLNSKHDVVRNNIVIILIEMCKLYTSFADKYVPLISLCFKDKLYLIRYQTIVLVVNLLQEGFIKWRGPLFFCLLSSLVDSKEEIRTLGRYSLTQLVHEKKRNLFSEHFVDSIFVYNNFPPPDNESVAQYVKDLERFALKGEDKREERMSLYRFLLESMDVKERAYLIKSMCEILTSVAESVYPLNEVTECIVRDCFAILTCKEIRAYNVEQFEDMDEATENEFCKTELDMRKIVIIDPVITVMTSLQNSITDPESDLMRDVIMFLKEFLHDFKDSIKDILAEDKILLRQVELEFKNDAERERIEKRMERDRNKQPEQPPSLPTTVEGLQKMIKDVSESIEETNLGDPKTSQVPSPPIVERSSREGSQHRNEPGTSQSTYNIATASPEEANELHRLASTPRVVLTKCPLSKNLLNISAIRSEPMHVVESDED